MPAASGAAPLAVFEAAEAGALLPLPETRFVLAKWSTATVGPDIHIKVGRTAVQPRLTRSSNLR
ncbi:hypothetical protein [Kitasatospora sp. NPDC005856]|uniref:hypothetical protein n=1 Tax=Kitasatospora sp. NPDC005856 TaxID=3154566 RepID=UPI0033CBC343